MKDFHIFRWAFCLLMLLSSIPLPAIASEIEKEDILAESLPSSAVGGGDGGSEAIDLEEEGLFTFMQRDPALIFGEMDEEELLEWRGILSCVGEFLRPGASDADVMDIIKVAEAIGIKEWEKVVTAARPILSDKMLGGEVASIIGALSLAEESQRQSWS